MKQTGMLVVSLTHELHPYSLKLNGMFSYSSTYHKLLYVTLIGVLDVKH